MKTVGRLAAMLGGMLILTAVVAGIAAQRVKQRIVPNDDPDADEIHLVAIFEPILFRSQARSLRGGTLDCWYGGGVVDLRETTLDPAGATLRVRTIFGGAHVVVPDGWMITSRVVGIGGLSDRRQTNVVSTQTSAPVLRIEGFTLFGGVGVSSELAEAEERGIVEAVARRGGGQTQSARE